MPTGGSQLPRLDRGSPTTAGAPPGGARPRKPKPSVPGTAPHPAPGADRTHGAPPTPAQTRHLTCARTAAQRFHSHGTHGPARYPPHATGLAPTPFPASARSAPSLPGGGRSPWVGSGRGWGTRSRPRPPLLGPAPGPAPPLARPGGCELTPTSLLPAPPGSVRPRSRPARCQRAGRGVSTAPGTRPESPTPTLPAPHAVAALQMGTG